MSTPDPEERRRRNNQLFGRLMIVALGILAAAYAVVTFLH